MKDALFYKTCRHGNCGSNVTFHNKDERGYGTDLKGLETYNLKQAQKEMDWQDGSLLLLKSEVDKFAVKHVDMQYLDSVKGGPISLSDSIYIQVNSEYDGNDIMFLAEIGNTFDLAKAKVFSLSNFNEYTGRVTHTPWLKSYLESISRDTFQDHNINKRKMITAGGIRYKTKRISTATGKSRGNCPTCGKLTWSYDPEANDYCKKHEEY